MITSFNKLYQTIKKDNVGYVKVVNQYNYTIKQMRVDNVAKTIEEGHFNHDTTTTTYNNYKSLIDVLMIGGYSYLN